MRRYISSAIEQPGPGSQLLTNAFAGSAEPPRKFDEDHAGAFAGGGDGRAHPAYPRRRCRRRPEASLVAGLAGRWGSIRPMCRRRQAGLAGRSKLPVVPRRSRHGSGRTALSRDQSRYYSHGKLLESTSIMLRYGGIHLLLKRTRPERSLAFPTRNHRPLPQTPRRGSTTRNRPASNAGFLRQSAMAVPALVSLASRGQTLASSTIWNPSTPSEVLRGIRLGQVNRCRVVREQGNSVGRHGVNWFSVEPDDPHQVRTADDTGASLGGGVVLAIADEAIPPSRCSR